MSPGADRRQRAGHHDGHQRRQGHGQREGGGIHGRGPAGAGEGGDHGEGTQPGRARQRRPHVQTADVIDLRDQPAQPKRPPGRAAAGHREDHVEHVLLADQHRDREVHHDQVGQTPQRAPAGDTPAPTRQMPRQQRGIDEHHQGDQPVVMHKPRMFQRTGKTAWDGPLPRDAAI
jgi:hypothetical protein